MWIGLQWKGNSALFPSGNKAINLLQIPSLGIFLFYLIGFHWKLVFPFSGTEVVLMGIHWWGPWGFRRWGQFFNPLAFSASVHHPELTPSTPDEVGRHGLGKAGQQPLPQLSLYVRGGRDGGPVLPVERAGPPPEGPSNSTEASSKVKGCGPLRDFYSRTLFSAASNIANAESGFSARTSGLSNSTTWKSEKKIWNGQKIYTHLESKPLKPLGRLRQQLPVPSHFPWPGQGHSWELCWGGGLWSVPCSLWRHLWWCSEQGCQSWSPWRQWLRQGEWSVEEGTLSHYK